MKKSAFLLLLFASVLVWVVILAPNIEQKIFTSTKFETKTELEKEYQFMKIISIPESEKLTAVDCYGQQLQKLEWYIHSKNAGSFCPISGDYYLSDYENADVLGKYSAFKATGQVKSDTIDIICPAYDEDEIAYHQNVRAKILTFGKRFIKFGFDGEKPIYWIEEPKLEKDEKREE